MLPIDELVGKTGNRYVLTTIVSKRAKQLNEGATIMVPLEGNHKPLFAALLEISNKTEPIEVMTEE